MANIHIVIGDAHDKPESNKRRFKALGNFLLETAKKYRKDSITTIDMGDFEDMPSLCSYDRGKLAFEGRRYQDDIASAYMAREFVYYPVNLWLNKQRDFHRKIPKVQHIALGGNHFEGRINAFVSDNPELEGVLSTNHAQYANFGVSYVPFLVPKNVDGIWYTHYWQQRSSSRPLGTGKYPATGLLRDKLCSTVVGHSHVLDRATTMSGINQRLYALSAGCFLDPDEKESYAGQSNFNWWKGIILLHGVDNGFPYGGEEFIPAETLIREYS